MTSPVAILALAVWFGAAQAPTPPPKKETTQQKAPSAPENASQEKAPANAGSKAPAKKPKRVFTNDDVEGRAPRPRETEEFAEPAEKPAEKKSASKADGKAPLPEETRQYYQERITPLRAELSQVESELSSARYKPEYDPQTGRPIISHTKQNEIERLERKRGELQKKIAGVCEEAARNNVYVGGC